MSDDQLFRWTLVAGALAAFPFALVFRVRRRSTRDEARLAERFGDASAAYTIRTGRFLPRIGG